MKTLIWFVLVISCAALAPAQERVIDKAEFDAVVNGGLDHKVKWKGEKYRTTIITSSTVTGRPQTDYSSKNITESGPSVEFRNISTSVFGGKPAPQKESLRIGDWLYTRTGNEAWTRKEYVTPNAPVKEKEESPRKIISSQAEYKYLGQSTLVNRPVHIYVKTERQQIVNEKTGESGETESKSTYWVDGKGVILKNEYKAENRGKNTMQTAVTLEWELAPSITFTPPEIVP